MRTSKFHQISHIYSTIKYILVFYSITISTQILADDVLSIGETKWIRTHANVTWHKNPIHRHAGIFYNQKHKKRHGDGVIEVEILENIERLYKREMWSSRKFIEFKCQISKRGDRSYLIKDLPYNILWEEYYSKFNMSGHGLLLDEKGGQMIDLPKAERIWPNKGWSIAPAGYFYRMMFEICSFYDKEILMP